MKLAHHTNIELETVNMEGAVGAKIRWLVSQKDGAPNFAMRLFEIDVDGQTPYHQHNYEHEIYVLDGEGIFTFENNEYPFKKGDFIYVDPDKSHNFRNVGTDKLKFLCLIPHQPGKVLKQTVNPFAGGVANNC